MSTLRRLQTMDHELRDLFPTLPRSEQRARGAAVAGSLGAESAVLSRAASALAGPAQQRSTFRRSQRLVANARLDLVSSQDALMPRVLAGRAGRLDLTLDATTTGASQHDPGPTTLLLAQPNARRAQPLCWRNWSSHAPDQAGPGLESRHHRLPGSR